MISSTNKLRGNDEQISGYLRIVKSPEIDDSDEERELTNLNWLLRNQNLTWSKTIDANSEDDINIQTGHRYLDTEVERINIQKKLKPSEQGSSKNTANKSLIRNVMSYPDSGKLNSTSALLKRPTPAERYDIFINKIKRDLVEYEKSANKYKTDVTHKPPFNYSNIIGMAMLENGRVTLQQICAWIESKFAFFRVRKKWNNSIRHNLSLHHCFRNRKREEKGKGGYWELGVDPKKCNRKRIRNRKSTNSKSNQSSQEAKAHQSLLAKYQNANSINDECSRDNFPNLSSLYMQNEKPHLSSPDNSIAVHDVQLDSLTLTEVEVGLGDGLTLPNGPHDSDPTFLYPDTSFQSSTNNEALHLEQQYELGTIIISTTGIIDDPSCLNSIISNKFGCSNMIYTEDEIPTASENIIISSHKMDSNKETNLALITPIPSNTEIPSSFTINCDYPNFRPYMDCIDEPYNYLHSNELNRNEDILDNLLDVCVRDY
ncbi:hepatocyte nuclear factor 3-beta [Drosophila hydei]|uniref:Hepatocyte nuclear factor 3-beta n=1 Tax=Drosophila hydei TaxID=7224 RepID=A0A6J1LIL1_DROHY|nr:hepatocyte nuclear factor 3-beta [Drosophila hydei]